MYLHLKMTAMTSSCTWAKNEPGRLANVKTILNAKKKKKKEKKRSLFIMLNMIKPKTKTWGIKDVIGSSRCFRNYNIILTNVPLCFCSPSFFLHTFILKTIKLYYYSLLHTHHRFQCFTKVWTQLVFVIICRISTLYYLAQLMTFVKHIRWHFPYQASSFN